MIRRVSEEEILRHEKELREDVLAMLDDDPQNHVVRSLLRSLITLWEGGLGKDAKPSTIKLRERRREARIKEQRESLKANGIDDKWVVDDEGFLRRKT